jgi:hypothetical protein
MNSQKADQIIQKLRVYGCFVTICHAPYPNNFIRIKLDFFLDSDWHPRQIQSESTNILLALQDAEKQYDQYSIE